MRLKLDTTRTWKELLAVAERGQRAGVVLDDIGQRMTEFSIPENFRQEGRPTRWAKSARGGRVGQDTGELARSVSHEVRNNTRLVVGTNLRYAAQFHHGGTIKPKKARALAIPATPALRHRRPADFADLFVLPTKKGEARDNGLLVRPDGNDGVEVMFYLRGAVTQPARPFLLWQTDDLQYAQRALSTFIASGVS